MRYQNWDVLIFPEGTKVPLQEFRTQCSVMHDPDDSILYSHPAHAFTANGSAPPFAARLPILTTFIPSIPAESLFRISIHCWDGRPKPSKFLQNQMRDDDTFAFEARVYVDGNFASRSLMSPNLSWPYVIEQSVLVDKEGQPLPLKFPAFHQEILHQSHWDAGELLGRIRVVIAEGFYDPQRAHDFEHMKDVLAFSFQHAPLPILEYSSIAWPNQSMWNTAIVPSSRRAPLRSENEDLHAHSPTRRQDHASDHHKRRTSGQGARPLPPMGTWKHTNSELRTPGLPWYFADLPESSKAELVDPFIDSRGGHPSATSRFTARSKRSTLEDVPMPDYANSISSGNKTNSRTASHMSGISGHHGEDPIMTELSEMYRAFSPDKGVIHGAAAPRNTPMAMKSPVGTIHSPSIPAKRPTVESCEETGSGSSGGSSDSKRKRTPEDSPKSHGREGTYSASGSAGGSARKISRVDRRSGERRAASLFTDIQEAATRKFDVLRSGAGINAT